MLPPLPMLPGCEIRHAPANPGYAVSTLGDVYSACLRSRLGGSDGWKLLKRHKGKRGYYTVCVKTPKGKYHTKCVHTMVLEAFVGLRPKGYECRHLNGIPTDNSLGNICWGTRQENRNDLRRHGVLKGEGNPQAKLSHTKVKAIRDLLTAGWTQANVAAVLKVHPSTVSRVATGLRWNHVNP